MSLKIIKSKREFQRQCKFKIERILMDNEMATSLFNIMEIQKEQLSQDIYWLGVKDTDLRVFDIIMETKYGTTYNAYMVNTSEGVVLVETVKEKFFDQYLADIKSVIGDLSKIKYLITNHTEPDHAGSIRRIIEAVPGVVVVASRTALTYLADITNIKFNQKAAEDLKELIVGNKTFQFISVPFLHWPDSMYSYLKEDKVLFTCDSFGSHYAPKGGIKISELPDSEEDNYQDALLYYYTAIFGPFKKYVVEGVGKIKDLELKMVCTGHGPVLDTRIQEIIGTYSKWSQPAPQKKGKKVVIPYVSAYGYTGELAALIEAGIKEKDSSIEVIKYDINLLNYGDLKGEILNHFADADGICFGTCTINGDALPFIWELALALNPIVHGGKVVSAFGSYGWSGEGVDNITDRLKQCRMKVIEGLKIKFRASPEECERAKEFGRKFAEGVITGKVPELKKAGAAKINFEDLNPSGQNVLWRCTICGEVYSGVVPPEVCPACGVGQELFELYEAEDVTFKSDKNEKFVIVGSGVAAVTAADNIRQRNKVCSIDMYTKDADLPYYRPSLSDYIHQDVPDTEFFLHPKEWYQQNKINVHLSTPVKSLNTKDKTVTLENGSSVSYDKLILANGSSAFVPPLKGSDLKGVFTMKLVEDARKLKEFAKGKKNAVVIGGGVLGLETADALLNLGLHVTCLEFMKRVMPRQLDEDASEFIKELLEKKDFQILLGVGAKEIVGDTNGFVKGVSIDDREINCDLVVINIGVRSNVQLAKDAGITVDRCVVVNEKMETNVPGVYAAGDLIEYNHMNICLWSPALEQGRVAGANAVGDSLTYKQVVEPLSFIAFDTELYSVGNPPVENLEQFQIVYEKDSKSGKFMKLAFKDGKLVYGVIFNYTQRMNTILKGVRDGYDYPTVMSLIYQ
ncbi:Pyridine nucleotide-disulfide oxidoreductase family protein [Tritrichomonas foetus]|uniref:Pyridine nucleotide-disulfide oxidoreductase family protein n=1 Tax=Tritrichomonas foetus TaxID=1144522 RepID=A0A1J4K862_9EUKA|nr:Pyridine nucleotide-disulfide oxidoreductase family protein [Tritrichomonas foetus]|eukprot:OHT07162.1 Pyridine nucleotide-disulfide oxidoreductase family protein [Tritrichomonas foetus]